MYYFLQTHVPNTIQLENGTFVDPPVIYSHTAPNTHVFDYDTLPCSAMIMNVAGYNQMRSEITKRDCPYVDDVPLSVSFC